MFTVFFFFKQKTAYEMRISDWSSDVCSSDLRLKADQDAVLTAFPGSAPTAHAPDGVRLAEAVAIDAHPLFLDGSVEVQDLGSQLVALACEATPGMLAVDLCAGAGGQALAIASAMANQGRLLGCDTDRRHRTRVV